MAGLGEQFRAAREARGLTLSDVADQIHIRSVYLAAIEEEDWSAIGAPVYVRGFIRTYARFLGLDVEAAVQRFGESAPAAAASTAPEPSIRRTGRRSPSAGVWIASVVALGLVAFVLYGYYQLQVTRQRTGTVAQATAAPVPSAAAASAPPAARIPAARPAARPSAALATGLALHVSQTSWLRIAVDGVVAMEGTYPAGTARSFHGKRAILRVGNAGGVEIAINGKDVGKLGAPGDVVERSFTIAGE